MDKGKYEKLNKYHVIFLVVNAISGLGILSLPNALSPMGYSQWLMPIFYGIVASLTMIPMIKLCKKYPKDNLFIINEKLLGKFLGKIANILVTTFGILAVTIPVKGYLEIMQTTTLPDKKMTGPLLLMIGIIIYVVHTGIKGIARYAIISFFLVAWIAIFLPYPISKGMVTHVLPIFNFNLKDAFEAFNNGYSAMFGYELIMFYFPYIINKKKALKHGIVGIWIQLPFYIMVCISSVIYFSTWQLKNVRFPVLNLLKSVELSMVERLENLLITYWAFLVVGTGSIYLWVTKKGFDSLIGKNRSWHLYIPVTIILFLIVGPIDEVNKIFLYDEIVIYLGYTVILWPILLLLIHKVKSVGRSKS